MTEAAERIYIVTTRTANGRESQAAHGSDGQLDIKLSARGGGGFGGNGGQLYTDDPGACFEDAVGLAVLRLKLALDDDTAINAEFDLCLVDGTHSLQAHLNVRTPGLPRDLLRRLAYPAGKTFPDTNLTGADLDLVFDEV
jgi:organic hydroperoxide reductase OsmC/OhrA